MLKRMIEDQIEARGVRDPAVLAALHRVDRKLFVAPGYEPDAYADGPLPIGEGQTISQPYIVALMTELACLGAASRVLEIGTGSGYQAAVLAEIVKDVFSIEIIPELGMRAQQKLVELGYARVHVRIGDGYNGWPEEAPFDAILVTAAPDHVPLPLLTQLKPGGHLVIPVGNFYQQLEVLTVSESGEIEKESIVPVRFVPMTGQARR